MFKIITLSDSAYFDCGQLFLKTRNVANDHDIVLYGPDLTKKQQRVLTKHNISYKKVDKHLWDTEMQFMKFENILKELENDKEKKYKGFFLIDWDVFFVNNWEKLYDHDFDLCLLARPDEIKKRIIRALVCGGAFFFKHSSKGLFEYARKVVINGRDPLLPEYNRIWQTLEQGRPKHKTHYRENHRWWVDQCFLSAIALRFLEEQNYKQKFGLNPIFTNFNGYKVAFVDTKIYNTLNSDPIVKKEKGIFVRHLKESGRVKLVGKEKGKIKEKL